jgi:hypothetical protein
MMRMGPMAAAAVLGMAATAAAAVPTPGTTIKIGVTENSADSDIVDSATTGSQSFSGSTGSSTYFAEAGPGILKVKGTTTGPVNNSLTSSQLINGVGVAASFTDVITVNAPGLTSGSFVATILIDGALSSAAAGGGAVVAFTNSITRVEVAGLADPVFEFRVDQSNYNGFVGGQATLTRGRFGPPYVGPLTGAFTFSIPFENLTGQTVTITQTCGVNARTYKVGDTSSGGCDYSHTITWGGINQVLDQNNAPVTNFTALGSNGTNYAQSFAPAVPEPSSWAMLIAGFGLVGAAARRQKRALRA